MKNYLFFLIALCGLVKSTLGQVTFYQGSKEAILQHTRAVFIEKSVPNDSVELKTPQLADSSAGYKYGVPDKVLLKVRNSEKKPDWIVKLTSEDAITLDIVLGDLVLGAGSEVYIYNGDRTALLGPINSSNTSDVLATPRIEGNTLYIHIKEGGKDFSSFTIVQVVHGIGSQNTNGRVSAITSLDCIPSATCYPAWNEEANAVGMITINGSQGSGTFLNNEAQDGRPFFLTAFHVLDNGDDILSTAEKNGTSTCSIATDYRWTTCAGSTLMMMTVLSGAHFRSAWYDTDFALIEAYQNPLISSDIRYAGWNRSGSTPSSGVFLHHPSGSHMRYSSANSSAIRIYPLNWKYIEVLNLDTGFLTGGSSGCAIFNGSHQVVGQLRRGLTATDCDGIFIAEHFGRFYDSWDGGGTSDTQLKHWLSPINNLSSMITISRARFGAGTAGPLCYGSNGTYNLVNVTSSEPASWSVSAGLSIVSSTYNSVTVSPSYSSGYGMGTITASFGSVQVQKNVWYGPPNVFTAYYDSGVPASTLNYVSAGSHVAYLQLSDLLAADVTGYVNWNPSPSIGFGYDQYFHKYDFTLSSGQTLNLNPVSATNVCGTSNRTLVFAVPSGFLVYPNPASEYLYIQFDNVSKLELLPEEIKLLNEKSTIPLKSISMEETFNSKMFKDGNKVVLDVSDLERGIYYLHIVHRDKKRDTEKIRILIE